MDGAKSPLRSLTIWSAAASALVSLLALFGLRIDPALADEAVRQGEQIVSAALALIAIYGRVRATLLIGANNDG
jgi:hypothetical protein